MSLDDQLLEAYIEKFYGYGNYRGEWWLVGMEEGGGDTIDDIQTRLRLWDSRGQRELEDVEIFSDSPEHARWFSRRPPLQPTWRKLIRLVLAAEGRPVETEAVRSYQGTQLGRSNGNTCILELLPLPSPSTSHWTYGGHSALRHLRDRQAYSEHTTPLRVAHLRKRILEHQPKAVIFYGRTYRSQWEQIAGSAFRPTEVPDIDVAIGSTAFVLTPHPTYTGTTNALFEHAGRVIANLASEVERNSP